MCRGVTKLNSAWGKKQVWRPHARTWDLSEANVLFWKKCLWHCDFLASLRRDSAPGELYPLAPLVTSRVFCNKNRKIYNKQILNNKINKFSSPNVMNFYSMNICNFRTQYGMDLAHTANKGYWRHFRFLRVVFVSLLCLPHAFFRRGLVFVLLIIKLFRHSTCYSLKVR